MKRRTFLRTSALSAFAISATGFIRFDGNHYIGDCETTSDILGPFYRPDSPVRSSLVIKGEKGEPLELIGKIKHLDCTTPYKNAKIEIWHCDANGVYDNATPDFKYRGTTYSDDNGNYSFQTILPVPYDTGSGNLRPAHFHMMITAEGYQPLVTQLYFNGDKHIEKDASANADTAKRRRLDVKESNTGRKVYYDVSMAKVIAAEPTALDKLTGIYSDEKDKTKTIQFFKYKNTLWQKNEVFGEEYHYIGNNTFEYPGITKGNSATITFELLGSGSIKCTLNYMFDGNKGNEIYWKV